MVIVWMVHISQLHFSLHWEYMGVSVKHHSTTGNILEVLFWVTIINDPNYDCISVNYPTNLALKTRWLATFRLQPLHYSTHLRHV